MVTLRGYNPKDTKSLLRLCRENLGDQYLCYYQGYFYVSFLNSKIDPQEFEELPAANCEDLGNSYLLFVRLDSKIIPVDQLDQLLLIEKKEWL